MAVRAGAVAISNGTIDIRVIDRYKLDTSLADKFPSFVSGKLNLWKINNIHIWRVILVRVTKKKKKSLSAPLQNVSRRASLSTSL